MTPTIEAMVGDPVRHRHVRVDTLSRRLAPQGLALLRDEIKATKADSKGHIGLCVGIEDRPSSVAGVMKGLP